MQKPPAAVEQSVGNDLLVRRILLRVIARQKVVVLRRQKHRQIPLHIRTQPLEGAERIKETTGDNKNTFVRPAHRDLVRKAASVAAGRASASSGVRHPHRTRPPRTAPVTYLGLTALKLSSNTGRH